MNYEKRKVKSLLCMVKMLEQIIAIKRGICMNIFLRKARLQAELTQEELASELGTTAVSIWRWEKGKVPSPFFRAAICAYFHLSSTELGWPSLREGARPLCRNFSLSSLLDPAIPLQPHQFVGQHLFLRQIEDLLCTVCGPQCVGLIGLVGCGKTAVMQQLSTASTIQKKFIGVFWASIGQKVRPMRHLQRWARLLGLDSLPLSLSDAQDRLRAVIGRTPVLFVLDDVWTPADLSSLLVGGPACRYVLTTRQPGLARQLCQHVMRVQDLTDDHAMDLLTGDLPKGTVRAYTQVLHQLIQSVGKLPLALVLMREYLRREAQSPRQLREAIARLANRNERLEIPDILQMETPWQSRSLSASIQQSERRLSSPARAAFRWLAQHFQDRPFTASEAAALVHHRWLHQELDDLVDAGLLRWSTPSLYQFHPILAEYTRQFIPKQRQEQALPDPWLLP